MERLVIEMHEIFTKIRAITVHEFLGSVRKVANMCRVSKSSVATWVNKGHGIVDQSPRKKRESKLPCIQECIVSLLAIEPRRTLDQIAKCVTEEMSVKISRSHVHQTLRKMGFTNKITSQCWKKQETDQTHPFFDENPYDEDLISVDESGFCQADRPAKGWGPLGERVHKGKPVRRKRVSAIVAINRKGIVALDLAYGGVKGSTFAGFIEKLPDGCRVLLDNCSIHKSPEVRETMARKRISPVFTPPYSPWFNPIENAFGQAKNHFRRARLLMGDLENDIRDSLSKVIGFDGMFRSSSKKWALLSAV